MQRVFGPDKRGGRWYFYAYVDGQQVEWGPYVSEEFARGARDAIERRLTGGPTARTVPAAVVATPAEAIAGVPPVLAKQS